MSKKNENIPSIESLRFAADLAWSARTPKSADVHNRYIFRLDSCGRWYDTRCQRFLFVVLAECGFNVPPDYVKFALFENDRFTAKYRVFGGQINLYINSIN